MKPTVLHTALRVEFFLARKLDRGTPDPGNISSDFSRLGVDFWTEVRTDDVRNEARQQRIELMGRWRNAIAHQDFPAELRLASLTLPLIRRWRSGCRGLARSFDRVMARYVRSVSGTSPW